LLVLNVAGPPVAPAGAAGPDTLRLGRASSESFLFSLIDVGVAEHIWDKVGIALDMSSFESDAQQQQAFAAGRIDIGFGSGPAMGYRVKGVPAIGVAEMYGAPANMAIVVPPSSSIKSVGDLKGKTLSVSSAGSLTDWLLHETSREQGWGPDGIQELAIASAVPRIATMDSGQTAGTVIDLSGGYRLEDTGKGRVLVSFGFIKHFVTHVIFASDAIVADRPDVVGRFLRGWFMTVAYVKAHKAETVRDSAAALHLSEALVAKVYDVEVPTLSPNGVFDPASVAAVAASLKELGILDSVPDPKTLYATRFVPVKL
jgi:NitT/TauT family transport system substrate-binding protein